MEVFEAAMKAGQGGHNEGGKAFNAEVESPRSGALIFFYRQM